MKHLHSCRRIRQSVDTKPRCSRKVKKCLIKTNNFADFLQESENVSIFAPRNERKFLVFERKVIRFANSNDCMFGITAL